MNKNTTRPSSILSMRTIRVLCLLTVISASGNPGYAADIFNGKTIYQSYCETCHGADGVAVLPGAPDFSRGKGLMQPDRSIFDVIWKGQNAMPGFQGVLEQEEVFDVIGYIRTFL